MSVKTIEIAGLRVNHSAKVPFCTSLALGRRRHLSQLTGNHSNWFNICASTINFNLCISFKLIPLPCFIPWILLPTDGHLDRSSNTEPPCRFRRAANLFKSFGCHRSIQKGRINKTELSHRFSTLSSLYIKHRPVSRSRLHVLTVQWISPLSWWYKMEQIPSKWYSWYSPIWASQSFAVFLLLLFFSVRFQSEFSLFHTYLNLTCIFHFVNLIRKFYPDFQDAYLSLIHYDSSIQSCYGGWSVETWQA